MRLYVSCLLLVLVAVLLVPISASAQTEVLCAAVHDSNGTWIARWQGGFVILEDQGQLVAISVGRSGWGGGSQYVFFTEPDCNGDMYMHEPTEFLSHVQIIGNDVWYADGTDQGVGVLVESWRESNGDCNNGANLSNGVPAGHFTLPPTTTPLHLEPEPCSTPEPPDPEQIINACVKNKGGAMRMVEDPADCTARETPITLLSP